jgi:hypothetical protein
MMSDYPIMMRGPNRSAEALLGEAATRGEFTRRRRATEANPDPSSPVARGAEERTTPQLHQFVESEVTHVDACREGLHHDSEYIVRTDPEIARYFHEFPPIWA